MLSEKEKSDLKKLASNNPLLEKVFLELESINNDPTKVFYKELNQTIIAISKELNYIRNGKKELAHIIGSDDKTFERISKLLIDSEKIFAGLRKGKEDVLPSEANKEKEKEQDEKISFLDKIANKKRKQT